jgi:uncharacterized protein YjbJ (UPF0337 family)
MRRPDARKEHTMDWNELKGSWKQMKGTVRQKWAKLTDDDVEYVGGSSERLLGKVQERYGMAKDAAKREIDDWISGLNRNNPKPSGV